MGGMGSGRRYQGGKHTTKDMRALDVRYLQRQGLLTPGRTSNLRWSQCGTVIATIQILAQDNKVILSYRYQRFNDDWENMEYPINLEKTGCNLGGQRAWFRCPAQGCNKRVAILYGGKVFACRHCQSLVYESTRQDKDDRARGKADRIRERLRWEAGILNPNGPKPKSMHWTTFHRLRLEHDELVNQSLKAMARKFRLFEGEEG